MKNNVDTSTIGGRIRTLREKKDWTQIKLARELNVTESVISRIENNGRVLTAGELDTISNLFNISIDYLVKGETASTANNPISLHGLSPKDVNLIKQLVERLGN